MSSTIPLAEAERLRALDSYALLDTPPEPEFDALTALAAKYFQVPVAAVSLVAATRLWLKSQCGLPVSEVPRNGMFCSYAILQDHPLIVPDATLDARFADSPLVSGPPHARFYAGAPLTTREGAKLGTLCLIDTTPRVFSEAETNTLAQMAAVVMTAIEARRTEQRLLQEITEHKRTNYRLSLLESSVENANDAILITEAEPIDQPGPRIIYANRAFTQISGYTEAEVLGKTPRILQGPKTDPEARAKIREALKGWKPIRIELLNYRKDGTEFWVELNIMPVANAAGCYTHWVSVQRETSASKEAQRVLEEARDEAQRANNAKSEFLSRMSHELRTPLNAILGFGQLLEMSGLSARQGESMEHVMRGGRHLLDLINEVLDIARIEAGKLELTFEPVHVASVLEEVVALVRPLANQQGVTLDITRAEYSLDGTAVLADRQRLKQILLNLLSNAIKYNRPLGRVDLDCGKVGTEADGRLRLSVRDGGFGISAEDLPKLFSPFERLNASEHEVEGTGIGLAISKRLVEAMNGSIEVESSLGEGSTFSLELPTAVPVTHGLERGGRRSAGAVAGHVKKPVSHTILYIEDNPSNLTLVEAILAPRSGLELLTATKGQAGLDLARERQPDLILLDLQLPDLTGDAVLRELREDERTCEIPVIMVSADATPNQIQRLLDLGATGYLTKPLNIASFLQTINAALATKEDAAVLAG